MLHLEKISVKNINHIILNTVAISILMFMACEKEPIINIVDIQPAEIEFEELNENPLIRAVGKTTIEGFTLDCLTFQYPFKLQLASDATSTVNNNNDVESVFLNLDDYVVDFVYPIEALNQNRDLITIQSVEQLANIFVKCVPAKGLDIPSIEDIGLPAFYFKDLCVRLSFPLTLRKANADSIKFIEDTLQLANALAKGYDYFQYPLNVIEIESGNTFTFNEDMELMEALFNCEENFNISLPFNSFDFSICFGIEYPITVVDDDGNTFDVFDKDVFNILLLSGKMADFVYPITLFSFFGGALIEVNDGDKIDELIPNCAYAFQIPPILFYNYCFLLQYPVEVTDYSGNATSASNDDELFKLSNEGKAVDFVYPIIANLIDGRVIEINGLNELNHVIFKCSNYYYCSDTDFAKLFDGELFCFDIDYPITIKVDDEEKVINGISEFSSHNLCDYYSNNNVAIQYPVTVTLNSDSSSVIFENGIEIIEYINDNCP